MAITRKSFIQALNKIANDNDLSLSILQEQIKDIIPQSSPFASRSAKTLALKHNVQIASIHGTGKMGKITSDDIRKIIGEGPSEWSSKQAEKLAKEHSFSPKDFPKRSGRVLKDGTITISVNDVKKKLGENNFASKMAKRFAEEKGVLDKKITGSGKDNKITKKDIQRFIENKKQFSSDNDSSDNDSSDSDSSDSE